MGERLQLKRVVRVTSEHERTILAIRDERARLSKERSKLVALRDRLALAYTASGEAELVAARYRAVTGKLRRLNERDSMLKDLQSEHESAYTAFLAYVTTQKRRPTVRLLGSVGDDGMLEVEVGPARKERKRAE